MIPHERVRLCQKHKYSREGKGCLSKHSVHYKHTRFLTCLPNAQLTRRCSVHLLTTRRVFTNMLRAHTHTHTHNTAAVTQMITHLRLDVLSLYMFPTNDNREKNRKKVWCVCEVLAVMLSSFVVVAFNAFKRAKTGCAVWG